ncbi:MAG: indole-3-glycerol-phosphate synthase TrpC, partial [Bacteroidetes bacterium]
MDILQKIVAHKREEVAARKARYPLALLEESPYFSAPCVSLRHYLTRPDLSGIIAEIKRRSPSQGDIHP